MRATLEERFWEGVEKIPGVDCWVWIKSTDKHGYGYIKKNNKTNKAHRVSYELHYGEIPDGLWVLHRCDNPNCTRPDHLFLGNAQDNNDDMRRKGRALYPGSGNQKGEANHNCRLSDKDVKAIREAYRWGKGPELAEKYGVHVGTIRNIQRGTKR